MGKLYKIRDFNFRLAPGSYVLDHEEMAAIDDANTLVNDAHEAAKEIIAGAEDVYRSEAERGFIEGLEEAKIESISMLLEDTRNLNSIIGGLETKMAALVVACVRKIIGGIAPEDQVLSVVCDSLKQMRREQRAEIRTSSLVYCKLKNKVDTIKADFPELEIVDIVEDSALSGEMVVVSTSVGSVECNIPDALDRLESLITSVYTRRPDAIAANEVNEVAHDIAGDIDDESSISDGDGYDENYEEEDDEGDYENEDSSEDEDI